MLNILEFTATWCPPCKVLRPVLAAAAAAHDLPVQEVDVDEALELATRYDVRSVPTVVLLRDGREVGRFIGLRSRSFVDGVLARARAGDEAITSP